MEESRQRLAEAETIAGDDEALLKPALLAEVELATRKGDFKRASERLDEVHRIVQTTSNDQEKHRVALNLAQASAALGDRATALESLEEAEQLLPDDAAAAVERTRVRALVDHFTRDFRSAAVHCEKAIDMGRELGLTYEVMVNLHNLGGSLVHLDDLPRAYGAFQQSLALCEESSYERLANYNRMFLAFLDGLQGTADGAKLLRPGDRVRREQGLHVGRHRRARPAREALASPGLARRRARGLREGPHARESRRAQPHRRRLRRRPRVAAQLVGPLGDRVLKSAVTNPRTPEGEAAKPRRR